MYSPFPPYRALFPNPQSCAFSWRSKLLISTLEGRRIPLPLQLCGMHFPFPESSCCELYDLDQNLGREDNWEDDTTITRSHTDTY